MLTACCSISSPLTNADPWALTDSLAEDHSVLQPQLEIGADLLPGDALDPYPQLSLLLGVVLLSKLGGEQRMEESGSSSLGPLG